MANTDPARAAIELSEEERELVAADLAALLPTLDQERRERYTALQVAVAARHVPDGLAPALEALLELALQTGRARARYRAEGEQTLTQLYARTPGGRELSSHLRQLNEALKTLSDQTIESLSVRMRTVGHFTVTIQTNATTITLAARPDTINIESISLAN